MQKIFPFIGFLLTLNIANAQKFEPSAPLDIPLILSGTFAELRGNHFHGGIDIKTQGRSGLKVSAVADGYVSRISVSPYGYGNALYLRHPEGYTTVYGHLNAFYPELEQWIEEQLRDRSKNNGNLYPNANQFPVSRGQLVAFSGNTGGSFGPHLHFEIRDTKTEEPLNPLEFGIQVKDTRKPDLRGLMWTDRDFGDYGTFKEGDTVEMYSTKGFDVFTTDKQDGANNNNGVYLIEASANGQVFFTAHYNRINFNTSRFINAHINYPRYATQRVRYTRLYELENNPLKITNSYPIMNPSFQASKGWISVAEDSIIQVDVSILDYEKNQRNLTFYLRGSAVLDDYSRAKTLDWQRDNDLAIGPIKVHIPSGALYNTAEFNLFKKGDNTYVIGEAYVPLQKHMTLSWELDSVKQRKQGWFVWEYDNRGKKSAITGERKDAVLEIKTRSTGSYQLDQDLKKPEVRIVKNTPSLRSNSSFKEIQVHAADDKTGIDRYSARIDGSFARIDFDYKKELLKVIIPKELAAGNHNLRIVVIDGVGNTTVKEYAITL
ncbi:M23 family metallopeptidase [Schleiferiaceae bacterium]|nr:M23 family metallopeptidase [Schleiferiaceae bacterium]